MFDKLLQAQQKAEEIKKRLDVISVSAEVQGGLIRIDATANKEIRQISIDQVFLSNADKEELEELLVVAVNKVLVQADKVSASEMESVTKGMLGGLF